MANELLYRALSPRFSHAPLSGRGAELSGGRWNAVGSPALYLACDVITAILEYQQRANFKPVTAVQYRLQDALLADIHDPQLEDRYGITPLIVTNEWQLLVGLGEEPPSWPIASSLQRDGYHGLRYRSRLNGGACIVLWTWNVPDGPTLSINDPDKRATIAPGRWPDDPGGSADELSSVEHSCPRHALLKRPSSHPGTNPSPRETRGRTEGRARARPARP